MISRPNARPGTSDACTLPNMPADQDQTHNASPVAATERSVRVYEFARTLGLESNAVLKMSRQLEIPVRSASSVLDAHKVARLRAAFALETAPTDERAEALILAAFSNARLSGRAGWEYMTLAVLKNRLLDITNREFDEADYSAKNMFQFANRFPNLLETDAGADSAGRVRLKDPDRIPAPTEQENEQVAKRDRTRVRPDLWKAIVDYRSGQAYVWDPELGVATPDDLKPGSDRPLLPTATRAQIRLWRQAFAKDHMADGEETVARLDEWITHSYGTNFLPISLRGDWTGFSRDRIVELLESFFDANHIPVPKDLLMGTEEVQTFRHEHVKRTTNENDLRALVERCVAVMSLEELAALRFGPEVYLRAAAQRERG